MDNIIFTTKQILPEVDKTKVAEVVLDSKEVIEILQELEGIKRRLQPKLKQVVK